MRLDQCVPGQCVAYYPSSGDEMHRQHDQGTVVRVTAKRAAVMFAGGVIRFVSPDRLTEQAELLESQHVE